MTRESSSPAWPQPLPEFVDFSWRRLLLLDPNRRAKAIPRSEMKIAAQVPTEILTNEVACIDDENASVPCGRNVGPSVQRCTNDRYQPATADEEAVLRLLRSVPLPLTVLRVSRALVWPEHRARRWISKFRAKGVLIATGKGHVWRDG